MESLAIKKTYEYATRIFPLDVGCKKKIRFFFVCYNLTCHSKAEEDLKYPTLKFMHYENEKKRETNVRTENQKKLWAREREPARKQEPEAREKETHYCYWAHLLFYTNENLFVFFFLLGKKKIFGFVLLFFVIKRPANKNGMKMTTTMNRLFVYSLHKNLMLLFFWIFFFFFALLFCAKQCMWREYLQTFLRNIWIGNPVRVVSHSNPWHTFILLWVLFPPPGLWAFSILFPL